MKYRMRPVEKEAWPIRDVLNVSATDPKVSQAIVEGIVIPRIGGISVRTAEGTMTASEDDYLVLGLQGEWYPVMRAVFEKSYERID